MRSRTSSRVIAILPCGRIPRPRIQGEGGGRLMARASRLLTPVVLLAAVVLVAPAAVLAQGSLNVYCSVQAEWCQAVANEFQRQTGIVGLADLADRLPSELSGGQQQ